MGHGPSKMLPQDIGDARISIARGVNQRDVLPNFGILDPKSYGIQDTLESPRVLFNFGRTNSEAVRLDHRIHPSEKVEITFLISSHQVAGKDHRFAGKTIDLPKALRGGFGRIPIAFRDTAAAVDKLARNTWRTLLAVLVENVKSNFGNSLTDGSRSQRELVRWQPGGTKSFG